jgi:Tfp pilus assembly protein PilO
MEQPTEVKKTEQIGAIMVLVLVIIIALIYLVIKPQVAYLKENNIQAAAKKAEFNDKEKQINNLRSLETSLASISSEVQKLSIALPKKEKISELIVQVDAIAKGQGLTVNSIAPSQANSEELAVLGSSEESTEPTIGQYAFTISVTGEYASLVSFLQNIEANLRPINIQKADFASGSGSNPQISATLTMLTYYQK